MALCLARLGLPSVIYDRRDSPSIHPRAHCVNTRTMELLNQWGLAEEVTEFAYKADLMPWDWFAAAGGTSKEYRKEISPEVFTSVAQDKVEFVLRRAIARYPDLVQLHWSHTCTSVENTDHGVIASIEGPNGALTAEARWCVAADGSRSRIRNELGIKLLGIDAIEHFVNIYFEGQAFPEGDFVPLGGHSSDPDIPGVFISMDGKERFTFQLSIDPTKQTIADFDEQTSFDIICRAMDLGEEANIVVKSVRPWTMSSQVAERMRDGNIFLAGDAAHCFPPTGGWGLNSGVQDAHNLAWKLHAVSKGLGSETLLNSYELERLPIVSFNAAQSFRNREAIDFGASFSPDEAQEKQYREIVKTIDAMATTTVRSTIEEQTDPDRRELIVNLEHGSAVGQDLGAGYGDSPVIDYSDPEPPVMEVSFYVPTASPGFRAPHFNIVENGSLRPSIQFFEDGHFTLITTEHENAWSEAAEILSQRYLIKNLRVGDGEGLKAADRNISKLYGIESTGAVLIRPDGFVSFRSVGASRDPRETLEAALRRSYGLPAFAVQNA